MEISSKSGSQKAPKLPLDLTLMIMQTKLTSGGSRSLSIIPTSSAPSTSVAFSCPLSSPVSIVVLQIAAKQNLSVYMKNEVSLMWSVWVPVSCTVADTP